MKICCRCKKLRRKFYKDPRAKDGLYSHCAVCDRFQSQERHKKCPEVRKSYFKKNKQRLQDRNKKWRQNNPKKFQGYRSKWQKKNRPYGAFKKAEYVANKKRAIPKWLTPEQLNEIRIIYSACPKGYEVDHIIPLQGENVSGLHVPWNLQYLTPMDNKSKGNRINLDI